MWETSPNGILMNISENRFVIDAYVILNNRLYSDEYPIVFLGE